MDISLFSKLLIVIEQHLFCALVLRSCFAIFSVGLFSSISCFASLPFLRLYPVTHAAGVKSATTTTTTTVATAPAKPSSAAAFVLSAAAVACTVVLAL